MRVNKLISKEKSLSKIGQLQYELAKHYIKDNLDSADSSVDQAIRTATSNRDKELLGKAYWLKAHIKHMKMDFRMTARYYLASARIYNDLNDPDSENQILNNISQIALDNGRLMLASKYNDKRLKLLHDITSVEHRADIYFDRGIIARHRKEPELLESYEYVKKALNILTNNYNSDFDVQISDILNELGLVYLELSTYLEKPSYIDSAKVMFERSLEFDDREVKKAKILHNIGFHYVYKKDYEKALVSFYRAFG
ncbi:MAG: hypothetical protein WBA74_25690, partial [Cyclobacteriaceae bacterium]